MHYQNLLNRNHTFLRHAFVAVVVSLLSFMAPHAVQAENADGLLEVKVDNFACVSDQLYRGAQPSKEALQQLADGGVKTIIDLRMDGSGTDNENEVATKLGLKYVHIPMGFKHTSDDQIAQFMSVVTNPTNQPVYVHCRQGADRTGTCCAVYRRVIQGWSYSKAYNEMRQHHFKPFLSGMKDVVRNCKNKAYGVAPPVAEEKNQRPLISTLDTDG